MDSGKTLPSLLSSNAFLLIYALPLLFASLILTFAGSFLTLDRTRSFAPHYDALPGAFTKKPRFSFYLEGGVGGVLIGYSFGLHLVTFLAVLIPNSSTMSGLSEKSFLATWFLSSLVMIFLGGRYKYAALTFFGITGGVSFSLALSVIIHPSLLTRIVLTSILIPLLTVLTLLPLQRTQHPSLRFAASSTGAFGVVVAVALLAHIGSWGDIWDRYWLKASEEWGTSKERGLAAGYCLFLCVGVGADYLLRRIFGECPDEKWDSYLASYTSNLPNRAGTFKPFESFWDRWFSTKSTPTSKDIIFPEDSKAPLHLNVPSVPAGHGFGFGGKKSSRNTLQSPRSPKSTRFTAGAFSATTTIVEDSDYEKDKDLLKSPSISKDGPEYELQDAPAFLKKSRSSANKCKRFSEKMKGGKKREAVKFRPAGGFDSSSDEEEDLVTKGRPWLKTSPSFASNTTATTLVSTPISISKGAKGLGVKDDGVDIDYEKELKVLREYKRRSSAGLGDGEVPEYSDYESDLGSPIRSTPGTPKIEVKEKEWTPGFIRRASQNSGSGSQSTGDAGSKGSRNSGTSASGSTATLVAPTPTTPVGNPPAFLQGVGMGAVPATPSLIKALDRVERAQKDAYGAAPAPTGLPSVAEDPKETQSQPREKKEERKGDRWESFWRDVRDKASS